jgi:hypothetical protein
MKDKKGVVAFDVDVQQSTGSYFDKDMDTQDPG